MVLSFTAEISHRTFAVEAIVSISSSPAVNSVSRALSFFIVISGFIAVDVETSHATATKNKSAKTVVVKNAKRSNTNQVVNTLLNGIGAPSAAIGVNGDFYIDTVTMNIFGPKKKNSWPLPKSLIGPAGTAGTPGAPGKQGASGKDGRDGVNGASGKDGERGPAGASTSGAGSVGPSGPAGAIGPAGPAGPSGPIGPAGANGSPGAAGAQGPAGTPGIAGTSGAAGAQGETGPRGLQGLPGAQGETGGVGSQGVQGIQGVAGVAGPAGPVRVFTGQITFSAPLAGAAGTSKFSNNFALLNPGKKYLIRVEVYGRAVSNNFYYLSGTLDAIGAAVTPNSNFTARNGNAYRSLNVFAESSVSIFSTIDGSGLVGADYQLRVTIASGDPTIEPDHNLTLTGFYIIEEVTAIN